MPSQHPPKTTCCTEVTCESGLRNNYFEGKRLTADSFRIEQTYARDRRQQLNRAIHGWGVVHGFPITASQGRLTIGPGLALDKCGRELVQARPVSLRYEDLIIVEETQNSIANQRTFSSGGGASSPQMCWLLSAHYAEQKIGPVTIKDSCSCEHGEFDHVCETVRYLLKLIRCDECCSDFACELTCDCGTGPCCDESPRQSHDLLNGNETARPHQRGGCRCLCEHLTGLEFPECGPLCDVEEECAHLKADLKHGVPLACLNVVEDDCDRRSFGMEVDACGPRRLVKRNDLLFDLIRGCDLTRISEIGWATWHRREEPVPFDAFSEALGPDGDGEHEYVTRDFWVRFSRRVRRDTLRPDCFAITVMTVEREGGWWQALRVPIVAIDTTGFSDPGDPADHVRGGTLVVDGAWVEDGVRGRRSLFLGHEARVEIEVRGDFIVDCNGQTVDANAIGLFPSPTGNGALGGVFLSTFRVAAAREAPYRDASTDRADRAKESRHE